MLSLKDFKKHQIEDENITGGTTRYTFIHNTDTGVYEEHWVFWENGDTSHYFTGGDNGDGSAGPDGEK